MPPSEHDLLPSRPWGELISTSRSRGTALRRRRRTVLGAPLPVAAALLLGLPLLPSGAPARDRVVTDVAEDTAPTTPAPALQAEELPPPALPVQPGAADVEAPTAAQTPGRAGPERNQAGGARSSAPTPGPVTRAEPADRAVTFRDAGDDARATGDAQAVQTFSRREYDILSVTFAAEGRGVRVEMVLLGDAASHAAYYGLLTDAVTGCTLRVLMQVDEGDSVSATCPGSAVSSRRRLAPTPDGQGALRAFVPYTAFPSSVDPDRPLALAGEAWEDAVRQPPPPPGTSTPEEQPGEPDVAMYDRASTDKRLSRRPR